MRGGWWIVGALALLAAIVAALWLWPVRPLAPHPFFAKAPVDRASIVAHRGGASLRPENTLWAFSAAQAMGADTLETDVHATADGVLVLLHDDTLERTTTINGPVAALTWEAVQAADAGAGFARGTQRPYAGQGLRVPTVAETLARFADARFVMELKPEDPAVARALCAVLREARAESRVLVGSAHDGALNAFREACPRVATSMAEGEVRWVYALSRVGLAHWYPTPAVAMQIPEEAEGMLIADAAMIAAAQARGVKVQIWTVNEAETMHRLLERGVDGLITDRVDVARQVLRARARAASACPLDAPTAAEAGPACARDWINANVAVNQLQAAGTHNSYKRAIPPSEMALIAAQDPALAETLDYAHGPLAEQLDWGARQLELDLFHDPDGGRFAAPLGPQIAAAQGLETAPFDASDLTAPGFKVFHIQDIDYRSSCLRFTECLKTIRDWSLAHPEHAPILILLNLKEAAIPLEGAAQPLPFDVAAFDALDTEIRSVFAPGHLIVPDAVQGAAPSLREGVWARGWPLMGAARGKVLFALDASFEKGEIYRAGRPSLEDRVVFVRAPATSPVAAYFTMNDPIADGSLIYDRVEQGYLIRTRADADTREARANDRERQVAAFLSGAQYVSTDYLEPDERFGPYRLEPPASGPAWCNPVSMAPACGTVPVED